MAMGKITTTTAKHPINAPPLQGRPSNWVFFYIFGSISAKNGPISFCKKLLIGENVLFGTA